MTKKTTKRLPTKTTSNSKLAARQPKQVAEVPTTLMGHLNELKSRLFWVAILFMLSAAAVYPFFDNIVEILTAPLQGEQLHFFTPAGGLSFIIKICMYLGVIGAMPAFVYHMYKFVQPVMTVKNTRRLVAYTVSSVLLAVGGIVFTYNIILPAAVKFLTNIEIANVSPTLSVDAYMGFVIAYIVAGALLFQLPLVMLIINGITPLKPSKLLSYERYVIVGSFIAAALLSPTPDVVNQALLAMPLVVMYQIGFAIIVVKNRLQRKKMVEQAAAKIVADKIIDPEQPKSLRPSTQLTGLRSAPNLMPAKLAPIYQQNKLAAPVTSKSIAQPKPVQRSIDGFGSVKQRSQALPATRPLRTKPVQARPVQSRSLSLNQQFATNSIRRPSQSAVKLPAEPQVVKTTKATQSNVTNQSKRQSPKRSLDGFSAYSYLS